MEFLSPAFTYNLYFYSFMCVQRAVAQLIELVGRLGNEGLLACVRKTGNRPDMTEKVKLHQRKQTYLFCTFIPSFVHLSAYHLHIFSHIIIK